MKNQELDNLVNQFEKDIEVHFGTVTTSIPDEQIKSFINEKDIASKLSAIQKLVEQLVVTVSTSSKVVSEGSKRYALEMYRRLATVEHKYKSLIKEATDAVSRSYSAYDNTTNIADEAKRVSEYAKRSVDEYGSKIERQQKEIGDQLDKMRRHSSLLAGLEKATDALKSALDEKANKKHDHPELFNEHNAEYDHTQIDENTKERHPKIHSLSSHTVTTLQELNLLLDKELVASDDPRFTFPEIPPSHEQKHALSHLPGGDDVIPTATEDRSGLMSPRMVSRLEKAFNGLAHVGKVGPAGQGIGGGGGVAKLVHIGDVSNVVGDGYTIVWNESQRAWIPGLPTGIQVPGTTVTDNSIARFDGTSGAHVQDSGITIDDSDNIGNLNAIQFNLTPTVSHEEGQVYWDDTDKTLTVDTDISGVSIDIGQGMVIRVTNKTGDTLSKGSVVYVDGAQGNRPTVALADADLTIASHRLIGVISADIANNGTGYAVTMGQLTGLDTSAYVAGTILYLSQTAGELTDTAPVAPAHNICVAMVTTQDATDGIICIRPNMGADLASLHDTSIASQADNDFLVWDNSNGYWKNLDIDATRGLLISDITKEPTGFPNLSDSTMSFDEGTRTFTIEPTGTSFTIYSLGDTYTFSTAQTVQITDTDGLWYIYFNSSGVLTASQVAWSSLSGNVYVATVYWDSTNTTATLSEERHGTTMDDATHEYLHDTVGAVWESGFTPSLTVDGDGSLDAHAEMQSISTGVYHDEDLEHTNAEQTTYEIWYKLGASGVWTKTAASAALVNVTATRPNWNEYTGGAWQLTEVANTDFTLTHIFATNRFGTDTKVILVMGQADYVSSAAARAAAPTELYALEQAGFPASEFVPIASVIIQCVDAYTNTYNARVISTAEGDDFVDFRQNIRAGVGASSSDHGNLTGLSDDDHIQYLLVDGSRGLSGNWDAGSYDITASTFIGDLTGNADTATLASTVTVADTTSTSCYISMFESATGSLACKTDGGLTYNASTGILTATGFAGPLTGNVTGDVTGSLIFAEGNTFTYDTALSADAVYHGEVIESQTLSGTVAAGDVVYLTTTASTWARCTQATESTVQGKIGIALGASGGGAVSILTRGWVRYAAYTHLTTIGAPVYIGTAGTTGGQTETAPTTGNFARIIGHCWSASADTLIFDPDNTWVEVA